MRFASCDARENGDRALAASLRRQPSPQRAEARPDAKCNARRGQPLVGQHLTISSISPEPCGLDDSQGPIGAARFKRRKDS